MKKYLDLLEERTNYIKSKIKEFKDDLKNVENETIKEYFEVGKKVIYRDREGYMIGKIVKVKGKRVTVDIENVNGSTEDWVKGKETFNAKEIELYK